MVDSTALFKIQYCFLVDFTFFKIVNFLFLIVSPVNLYGHSVQVFECFKTCTDTVRSVRSGGYAHDSEQGRVHAIRGRVRSCGGITVILGEMTHH